ncbi:MAG: hypothetical protein GX432_13730 [Candidatus Atribacteria bacterium]|nr:hypothetical protein [Candidatus Atribacteria bacterium]
MFNLLSHGYVGKKHTPVVNACKGFPKHEIYLVKEEIDNLVIEGYLVPKPTGHGLDVSINPHRLAKIKNLPGIKKILQMNPYLKGRLNF